MQTKLTKEKVRPEEVLIIIIIIIPLDYRRTSEKKPSQSWEIFFPLVCTPVCLKLQNKNSSDF